MNRWLFLFFQWFCVVSLIIANIGLQGVSGPEAAHAYQGFGASTPGGAGQALYRVTTLHDRGAGSLREAVSQGSRTVVFEVGGGIKLTQDLWVKGAHITSDGSTAPAPGITLKYGALLIHGHVGAHDVIVRHVRSRASQGCDTCDATGAGIGIGHGAYNVVLDHVSVQGAQDQALAIGGQARDITVQWSLFARSQGAGGQNYPILVAGAQRVSLHHNLFIDGYERLPQVMWSNSGARASDTTADVRHNLVWDWGSMATMIWKGARANVVGNYYDTPGASENQHKRAIFLCHAGSEPPQCDGADPALHARAYTAGNVSGQGPAISQYLNRLGTESGPFSAPSVGATDACTAARAVEANAGARPLDKIDQHYLGQVSVRGCKASPSEPAPPSSPDPDPVPAPDPGDGSDSDVGADVVEAEDYTERSTDVWLYKNRGEDGSDALGMSHGAFATYRSLLLGEYSKFKVRAASGNRGGTITLRTNTPNGPVVGKLTLENTGGFDSWSTFTTNLVSTTGTLTLYLIFENEASEGGLMMLVDWFE
jgi:Carbohydrate binding module (family 6)